MNRVMMCRIWVALLNKKIKNGGITDDQIRQIVEQYLKDNPVPTDKTLTIEDTPADAKATGDAINAIKDTVDNLNDILLDKFFSLQRTGKIYGVKVPKSTSNPTSLCEKTRDNKDLVCVPSTDTVENQDDYENIPLFKWYEVNYKRYDDGFAYPTAFVGDSTYKTDGNVDMGAMQMTFY